MARELQQPMQEAAEPAPPVTRRARLSSGYRRSLALLSLCCAMSIASAIALVVEPAAASREPAAAGPVQLRAPVSADVLDMLRADASLGSIDASAELAGRLLDRYERTGNRDDLHEAMQWIARDWDEVAFVRTDVVNRMVSGHCARPVLKWHWMCSGE